MNDQQQSRADALTEIAQFLTDVVTAAGLLSYGHADKKLVTRITDQAYELRKRMYFLAASPVEQPAAAPASANETGAEGASERFIVIGHGESDIPEAKIVALRADVLDAVLSMIYGGPCPDDAMRAEYASMLSDWDGDHWNVTFEIGGIDVWRVSLSRSPAMAAAAPAEEHSTIECQAHSGPDCTECGGTGAWSGSADERAALQWAAGTLQEIVSGRWKGAKESDKVSIGSVTKTVAQVLDMADAALGRASQGDASAEMRKPDAYVPIHPRNGPLWASAVTSLDADRPKSYPVQAVYLGASTAALSAARAAASPAADEAQALLTVGRCMGIEAAEKYIDSASLGTVIDYAAEIRKLAAPQPALADAPADVTLIPYDGLTEEFTDEVARLANDAPGIREAVAGALQSCGAIIAPADAPAHAAECPHCDGEGVIEADSGASPCACAQDAQEGMPTFGARKAQADAPAEARV
ncbi:hypothetical protein [Burkholderia pseudomallei]|uniref:hypothetical protein n=1 Tax=Burkholderia pseudomallei TaxID=28450 RepID=UPI000530FA0C|nr:hypothetical protein [Burkholderia pseudomallei]KGS79537.1 putative gp43 [Burkholderia pseudomallei MSHR5596]